MGEKINKVGILVVAGLVVGYIVDDAIIKMKSYTNKKEAWYIPTPGEKKKNEGKKDIRTYRKKADVMRIRGMNHRITK
jgi:hypothetical protein